MPSKLKQDQLQVVVDAIRKAPNFALVKFEKTTHKTLEALRKELRGADSQVKVVKNTLLEKAINKLSGEHKHFKELHKQAFPIKEKTALMTLGSDWSKGLKAFHTFIQKETSVSFKSGYLEETVYNAGDMVKISTLPAREQLVAKVIGGMKSPMYSLAYSLKYNMQKFVYVLSEKSKQTA